MYEIYNNYVVFLVNKFGYILFVYLGGVYLFFDVSYSVSLMEFVFTDVEFVVVVIFFDFVDNIEGLFYIIGIFYFFKKLIFLFYIIYMYKI